MIQLPPTAVPTAPTGDAGGIASTLAPSGGRGTAGSAASVFASLLAALQAGQTTPAASAAGLAPTDAATGTVGVPIDAASTTDEAEETGEATGDAASAGEAEGEIPAGLAALVRSLMTAPVVTAPPDADQTPGADPVEAEVAASPATTVPLVAVTETEPVATPTLAPASTTLSTTLSTVLTAAASPDGVATARGISLGDPTAAPAAVDAEALPAPGARLPVDAATEPMAGQTLPTPPLVSASPTPTDTEADAGAEGPHQTAESPTATVDVADAGAATPHSATDGSADRRGGQDHGAPAPTTIETAGHTPPTASTATDHRAASPSLAGGRFDGVAEDGPGVGTASAPTNVPAAPAVAVAEAAGATESADGPTTLERITLREMPTVVVDRIRAIDPQGGVNRAVVRLDPPELGRILLEVVSDGDEIAVIARAENAEAVKALVRQRSEIQAAVEALGLTVSDFDVRQGDDTRDRSAQEDRRGTGYDDTAPTTDPGFVAADKPTSQGELFL